MSTLGGAWQRRPALVHLPVQSCRIGLALSAWALAWFVLPGICPFIVNCSYILILLCMIFSGLWPRKWLCPRMDLPTRWYRLISVLAPFAELLLADFDSV